MYYASIFLSKPSSISNTFRANKENKALEAILTPLKILACLIAAQLHRNVGQPLRATQRNVGLPAAGSLRQARNHLRRQALLRAVAQPVNAVRGVVIERRFLRR